MQAARQEPQRTAPRIHWDIIKITYFRDLHSFLEHIRMQTDYTLVAVEQTERSEGLTTFKHPEQPCFVFGNENAGLGDDCVLNCERVVEIEMNGYHPCLNVGQASSVIFYDYCGKNK